jgi:hypothetical protein
MILFVVRSTYSTHSIVAELETLNNGKPVKVARDFDIGDSIQCLRYYAGTCRRFNILRHDESPAETGWADKILGEVCAPKPCIRLTELTSASDYRSGQQDQVRVHEAGPNRSLWANVSLKSCEHASCRPTKF